jgi:1,4-dihydroxy-2-naphthoyl-CoA hydrolase
MIDAISLQNWQRLFIYHHALTFVAAPVHTSVLQLHLPWCKGNRKIKHYSSKRAMDSKTTLWKKQQTLEELQAACTSTLVQHMGIEFTAIGNDFIEARMPVDERTMQPMGLLHGGASAALAETLGGAGAYLCVEEGTTCVGLEINANHVRPAHRGWVVGRATQLHQGRTTQVWNIMIRDEQEHLICISRLTVAVR